MSARRNFLIAVHVLAAGLLPASAVAAEDLDAAQQLGRQLFGQSCAVCHLKQQLGAQTFGPPLSKASLGGQDDVMREVIANGTPRMPAFKYHFEPTQIDAIVRYLEIVPAQ
jgi:mono/diheme cytochrome c family protein